MNSNSKIAKNIIFEILALVIILIVLGVVVMTLYKPFQEINTDIQNSDMVEEAKNVTAKSVNDYPTLWDGLVLTALILLWIVVIVLGFYIDSHPAFFTVSLILMILVLVVIAYIGNAFSELGNFADMSPSSFPKTLFIFDHLLLIVFVMGISVLLVIYAKSRAG